MLKNSLDGGRYYCPRCNFIAEYSEMENPKQIEHLIIDNLNRKKKDFDKTIEK